MTIEDLTEQISEHQLAGSEGESPMVVWGSVPDRRNSGGKVVAHNAPCGKDATVACEKWMTLKIISKII